MAAKNEDQLYDVLIQTVGAATQLPFVKVDRRDFLTKQFKNHPELDTILALGPQAVFTLGSLKRKSQKIIDNATRQTTLVSFTAGLPGNPFVAAGAGTVDVVQYFGFALNLAQQIAYLYGEDELFTGKSQTLSEEAKFRVITYLGIMMGASGAAALLPQVAKTAGKNIGKKVARQALTRTTWYPMLKKVGATLGYRITRQTVQSSITKALPLIGGVISGGLTYMTFKPMGEELTKTLAKNLKGDFDDHLVLRPEFVKAKKKSSAAVIDGELVASKD